MLLQRFYYQWVMKWFMTRVQHTEKQDNSRALTIPRLSFLRYSDCHSYDTQTVIPTIPISFLRYSDRHSHHTHFISTILRLSFLPYPFHPYLTLTFIPPKIYRPGWKPL